MVVERAFGSIKHWFVSGKAPYKRLYRVHAQHLMEDTHIVLSFLF
ncbi:MAG: hypothetical protein ACMUEL_02170 [Flavobacteriales bacterium Tduv]